MSSQMGYIHYMLANVFSFGACQSRIEERAIDAFRTRGRGWEVQICQEYIPASFQSGSASPHVCQISCS